jgi:hypothetical protein
MEKNGKRQGARQRATVVRKRKTIAEIKKIKFLCLSEFSLNPFPSAFKIQNLFKGGNGWKKCRRLLKNQNEMELRVQCCSYKNGVEKMCTYFKIMNSHN